MSLNFIKTNRSKKFYLAIYLHLFIVFHSLNSASIEKIYKLDQHISIDGSFNDWSDHPYITLGCNSKYERSFSGVWRQGWKDNGLYFALRVWDDQYLNTNSLPENFLDGDCLELYTHLDASYKGDSQSFCINFDYFEVDSHERNEPDIIDDRDSCVSRKGIWWFPTHADFLNDSASLSEHDDSSMKIVFSGHAIRGFGPLAKRLCDMRIFVDGIDYGIYKTKKIKSGSKHDLLFEISNLSDKQHVLKIERVGFKTSDLGVSTFLIKPFDENGKAVSIMWRLNDIGPIIDPENVQIASKKLPDGWAIEGVISWEALGVQPKPVASQIRLGFKVYDSDRPEDDRDTTRTLGLRRHDTKSRPIWVAEKPGRFPRFEISEETPSTSVEINLYEVVNSDKAELCLDLRSLIEMGLEDVIMEFGNGQNELVRIPLHQSVSERFVFAKEYFTFPEEIEESLSGKLILSVSGKKEIHPFRIDSSIFRAWRKIDSRLVDNLIDQLPQNARNYVHLCKSIAREKAGFYSEVPGFRIPHYFLLPLRDDHQLLESEIEKYIKYGEIILEDPEAIENFREFPTQAFQSALDGSYQPFYVQLPEKYEPGRTYPLTIRHWGINPSRKRDFFFNYPENEERIGDDHIIIIPNSRGNSSEFAFEDDLNYIIPWATKNLKVDLGKITLMTSSGAGNSSLKILEYCPDLFWRFDSQGCPFGECGWLAEYNKTPSLIDYAHHYDGTFDKLGNLGEIPVRLVIGEHDYDTRHEANQRMRHLLDVNRIRNIYEIQPGAWHQFTRSPFPSDFGWDERVEEPREFKFETGSLRYADIHWVSIEEALKIGKKMSVEAQFHSGNHINLFTRNIRKLRVFFPGYWDKTARGKIVIDFDWIPLPMEIVKDLDYVDLEKSKDGWRLLTDSFSEEVCGKKPGNQGPIEDIMRTGFIIVYGSSDPEMVSILRRRAWYVREERMDGDVGEWNGGSILVKSDEELTQKEKESCSLWLIGNSEQNSIVRELEPRLPISIQSDGFRMGEKIWKDDDYFLQFIIPNYFQKLDHTISLYRPHLPLPRLRAEKYILIEAGASPKSYLITSVFENSKFDYGLFRVDGLNEPICVSGLFDTRWGIGSGSKEWQFE